MLGIGIALGAGQIKEIRGSHRISDHPSAFARIYHEFLDTRCVMRYKLVGHLCSKNKVVFKNNRFRRMLASHAREKLNLREQCGRRCRRGATICLRTKVPLISSAASAGLLPHGTVGHPLLLMLLHP